MEISRQIALCAIVCFGLTLPAVGEVRGWFVPSAVKVLRDAKPVDGAAKWEHDPMKLEKVRRELGSELEKATADARKNL